MSFIEEIEVLQSAGPAPSTESPSPPNSFKMGRWTRPSILRPFIIMTVYLSIIFIITIISFILYYFFYPKYFAILLLYIGMVFGATGSISLSIGIFRLITYCNEDTDLPPPVLFPLNKIGETTSEEDKVELYECIVCRTHHRDVFSSKCRHITMCIDCATKNTKCPICTLPYEKKDLVRIFFS